MIQFQRVYSKFLYGTSERSQEGDQDLDFAYKNDGYLRWQGLIRKWPGYTEIVDFGDTVVRYLTYWEKKSTSAKTYLAITDNGTLLDISSFTIGGQKTSLTGGAGIASAQGSKMTAAQLKETLAFAFSKVAPRQTVNGTSIAALTGWPPVYPARTETELSEDSANLAAIGNPYLVMSDKGRLDFAGDPNNIDTIYESAIFRADVYTPTGTSVGRSGYISITPGDNKGGITALGTWNNNKLVFKQGSLALIGGYHQIDVTGNNPYGLVTEPVPHGTRSYLGIQKKANDVFYVDDERVARSLVTDFSNIGDLKSSDLSFEVQNRWNEIPLNTLPYIVTGNHKGFNQIWIGHYKGFADHTPVVNQTLALWHLDGDLLDSTGRGLTLTNNGTTLHHLGFNLFQDGSMDFDGSTQWLSNATSSNGGSPLTDLTCEVVIRPDTLPSAGNKSYVIREQSASGEWAIYLENTAGTHSVVFSVTDSGGTERKATYDYTTPLTWLDWTKIAGKWTGSEAQLFINGLKRATAACASIKTNVANGISIASSAVGSSANGFDGKIDEIVISGVEVPDSDISYFAGSVSTRQNRVQSLDYGTKEPRTGSLINGFDQVTNQVFPTAMMYVDGNLFTGTADGKILLEYSSDTRGMSSREADYTFGWDNLSQSTTGSIIPDGSKDFLKGIDEIEVKYAGTSGGELRVSVSYYDRSSGGIHVVYLEDDSANSGWGSNWGTMQWSSGIGRRVFSNKPGSPIYPYGFGEAFQITLHTHQENKPIDIKEVIVKGRLLAKI